MKKTAQEKQAKKAKFEFVPKRWIVPALTAVMVLILIINAIVFNSRSTNNVDPEQSASPSAIINADNISLPNPDFKSSSSIESVLRSRRTRRAFQDTQLSLKQVSQMLWAAQGITVDWGGRTAPSAKSTYPLSIFLIANDVAGLEPGEYQYISGDRTPVHQLKPLKQVELQKSIFEALNESSFQHAPAVLIITGSMGKMAEAYGGIPHDKEVYLEAGHAAQNLYLQAESLKLGMVTITGFDADKILGLVTIPDTDTIIYLIPFGIPKL